MRWKTGVAYNPLRITPRFSGRRAWKDLEAPDHSLVAGTVPKKGGYGASEQSCGGQGVCGNAFSGHFSAVRSNAKTQW